jgi:hypothetical protein
MRSIRMFRGSRLSNALHALSLALSLSKAIIYLDACISTALWGARKGWVAALVQILE